MLESGIEMEIHEVPNGTMLFGLKWGQGVIARTLGFSRKDVIATLNWCDKNAQEALKIIGF